MHFHENRIIAGPNAKIIRLESLAAKRRAKNRQDGIPDMEPLRHSPVEWFAEVGFHSVLLYAMRLYWVRGGGTAKD